MYNYGTKSNPILKKDGKIYRFELQDCTFNGLNYYKVFHFAEDLDAWEYVGCYLRAKRTTLTQMYNDMANGYIETEYIE